MPRPRAPSSARRRRQHGQTLTEYVVVAGILAAMLFAPIPGGDLSAIDMLIKALKEQWAAYSYTISYPW